ncbi:hypothetical protein AZE42_10012 [Rhizopogon vesiculosus]|uniref:Serine-threonine/tyrosine-protein kinase catalytic domain-containing protein n=1 Tax=Rhizopogon vesiculosus TaxID=180088 RepID=A0A1J8RAM3_9AGAM|nr:hypothetical protein AZE42_10012 [Rhizopogon vesiculosus]
MSGSVLGLKNPGHVRIPQSDDTQVVEKAVQRIRREAYVWIGLKHNNILKFHGIVEGFGLLPALVSPWMENGSLDRYLKQNTDLSKVEIIRMVRAVTNNSVKL